MPEPSRIDSKQLQAAADTARKKLEEAYAALALYLALLTSTERKNTLRPPSAFHQAGKELARAVIDHPVIAGAIGYDPKAVLEDLTNIEILAPVAERAEQVLQLVNDARLAWTAQAYVPSLQVYGIAKIVARTNAEVQKLVTPLAEVFGSRVRRKGKKTETL